MDAVTYIVDSTGGYWCNECQRQIFDSYHFCSVSPKRQGWQCPVCKVVHSPDINQCRCCVNPFSTNINYHLVYG